MSSYPTIIDPQPTVESLTEAVRQLKMAVERLNGATTPGASGAPQRYLQAQPPDNPGIGDIWADSTDAGRVRAWNGHFWVDVSDSRFSSLEAKYEDVNGLVTAATERLELVYASADAAAARIRETAEAQFYANYASIEEEKAVRATADAANASSISTLSAAVGNNSASITTLQNATANINGALSVLWSVQGYIDGVTGGLRLTGVRKADGSGTYYNLIIDANTTINGNLLVNGSVVTTAAADNAFTEGTGSFGTWMAECDIVAKKAGDKFIVIGSYVGGATSAGAFGGSGVAGNLNFDLDYNATPFLAVPIRGFCYNVTNFFGAYTFYFMTTATTFMAVVTAAAAGNHHFRVWTSDSANLAQGVSVAAIRLSK